MTLYIKVSCVRQMVYSKVMTWMMLHSQRDADIYIYIYIFFFFSFSLQCWSIYPKFQFSLFINILLWSSTKFYSHCYISKKKNIYSFINQILQLKQKIIYSLGVEQMQSFSLWLWPFTLKFPVLHRWCIPKSWHEWCYIVSMMWIYIYIYILSH